MTGVLSMNTKLMKKALANFLDSHISTIPECGCWVWEENDEHSSKFDRLSAHADKFFYRVYRGTVPNGHQLVHTCRMSCCVNPQHLTLRPKINNTNRQTSNRTNG